MKKNLVFKLGLFCAALVFVATCFVTNAWAKYTKTVSATDSARVAKFDFTVSEVTDLVETEFTGEKITIFDTSFVNILTDGADDPDELASVKVIAPGSNGTFDIKLANDSEVAVKFTLTAVDENPGMEVDHDLDPATPKQTQIIPIVWNYNGSGVVAGFTTLEECLEHASDHYNSDKGYVIQYDGDDITITVTWSWAYEIVGTDEEKKIQNNIDTALGLAAQEGNITYTVTVFATATQVLPA